MLVAFCKAYVRAVSLIIGALENFNYCFIGLGFFTISVFNSFVILRSYILFRLARFDSFWPFIGDV